MKIIAASDLHGNLNTDMGFGDMLIIAGDISPMIHFSMDEQHDWFKRNFIPWLETLNFKYKVFILGNHDFFGKLYSSEVINKELPPNCHYLFDQEVIIEGVKIYGTPWSPIFFNWAFMRSYSELEVLFSKISNDTNILISHSPPEGILDLTWGQEHAGSLALKRRISQLNMLKYNIFGHIHEGHGQIKNGNITYVNASILDNGTNPIEINYEI